MDLSVTELIDAAKQIEAAGEAFYVAALAQVREPSMREVFRWLAVEEARHAEAFEELLLAVVGAAAQWRDDEQYLAYLRARIEGHVFPSPDRARQAAARIRTDAEAIALALGFERDTIQLLEALREQVRPRDRGMVDQLLAEEARHVRALEDLGSRRS